MSNLKQARNARYYAKHKDTLNSRRRKKYATDPATNLAGQRLAYIRQRDKRLASAKEYYTANKDKLNEQRRIKWATDEAFRIKRRMVDKIVKYGITAEEYLELYRQADGICTICGTQPKTRGLNIDHDHVTGKVRGLLCGNCNTALGLLKENPETIQKLLEYLILHT